MASKMAAVVCGKCQGTRKEKDGSKCQACDGSGLKHKTATRGVEK